MHAFPLDSFVNGKVHDCVEWEKALSGMKTCVSIQINSK